MRSNSWNLQKHRAVNTQRKTNKRIKIAKNASHKIYPSFETSIATKTKQKPISTTLPTLDDGKEAHGHAGGGPPLPGGTGSSMCMTKWEHKTQEIKRNRVLKKILSLKEQEREGLHLTTTS